MSGDSRLTDLRLQGAFPLNSRPKLFFCDVDRTLLTADHRLLPSVRSAMHRLKSIQLPVILASARSPVGVERVHSDVKASDTVCCFNGAWLGNLRHRETIRETRLDRSLAIDAMSKVHDAGGSPIWFDLDCCYALQPDESTARRRTDVTGDELRLIDAPDEARGEPFKLLATFPADATTSAVETLSRSFAGGLTVAQSGPNLVELVSIGVQKDFAASVLADLESVSASDVVAAGDSGNDLGLLRWAGLAITVSNAEPHIRHVANVVAPSCDDGGLAVAVSWLIDEVSALGTESAV